MTSLFTAELEELDEPETSESYEDAIALCNGRPDVRIQPCPYRDACRDQALRTADEYTVRCGLRLWIPEERALL